MTYTYCCEYSIKTPDDGQRNCPKHVELYSKNKFGKLVHLVGFITRINHYARSSECQISLCSTLRIQRAGVYRGAGGRGDKATARYV
jgi:hypothetical protein